MKTRSEILDEFRDCIAAYRKAKEEYNRLDDTSKVSTAFGRRLMYEQLRLLGKIQAFEFVLLMKLKDIEQ